MVKSVVIVLAGMLLVLAPRAFAQDEWQNESMLAIGVGDPGSPSYMVGLWLSSLLRAGALVDDSKTRIELWESLSPADRVVILFEEAQLAVIPLGKPSSRSRASGSKCGQRLAWRMATRWWCGQISATISSMSLQG